MTGTAMTGPEAPLAVLLELTHRCPFRCPYCSNPLELDRRGQELDTAAWRDLLGQAAALGVLQVHFSGGEPTARPDLEDLVAQIEKMKSGTQYYVPLSSRGSTH